MTKLELKSSKKYNKAQYLQLICYKDINIISHLCFVICLLFLHTFYAFYNGTRHEQDKDLETNRSVCDVCDNSPSVLDDDARFIVCIFSIRFIPNLL